MTSAETFGHVAVSGSQTTVTLLDVQCRWTKDYLSIVEALADMVTLKLVNDGERLQHTVHDTDASRIHFSFNPHPVKLRFLTADGCLCTSLRIG